MNLNVPPKDMRTESTLSNAGRYKRPRDQGEQTRAALVRALTERPGAEVRELCVMVGKASTSTIAHHLHILEAEGKIVKDQCPLCRARIWRVA